MPEPYDLVKTCTVHKDATVRFEGRSYAVPFSFAFSRVDVRGSAETVVILVTDTGMSLITYTRHRNERILIDPVCY